MTDLAAIRARHVRVERGLPSCASVYGAQAHADRGALLNALDAAERDLETAIGERSAFEKLCVKAQAALDAERTRHDRLKEDAAAVQAALDRLAGRAALARLAEVTVDDIAGVLWGMDTRDCGKMAAAVLALIRARVAGP